MQIIRQHKDKPKLLCRLEVKIGQDVEHQVQLLVRTSGVYELAKILGHSNIKMTERYAKLAKTHIAKTGNTAREMWILMTEEMGIKFETGS